MKTHDTQTADDRQLAESVARHGDETAFRILYRRHTPRLYQVVLRVLGGAEQDAEDAVQETWVRACRGLAGFRWDCAFASWLTGIGLNVARRALQRRPQLADASLDDLPELPAAPPPLDGRVDLERAVASLPDGCREVLVLHDIEGMTHQEIAGRLGVVEGTSKSQLFAARRLLRARLGCAEVRDHA